MSRCESDRVCQPRRSRTAMQGDVRWAMSLLASGGPEDVQAARRVLAVHEGELSGLCHVCAREAVPAHLREASNG